MVWKSVERLATVAEGEIENAAGGRAEGCFDVTCPAPAHYRLRVVDCFSGTVTETDLDATDERGGNYALALNRPEQLELTLDKDAYTPGSTARVLVKTPFSGTMLLTVETDRVIDQRVLELGTNSAEVDLPVDENLRGGAFISATVIRKVDPSDTTWLPHRATGMARLATEHSRHQLPVTIVAPQQAQPRQNVKVAVRAPGPVDPASPAVVHLWAVDEGILLTTAYETPDPLEYFFAPRQAAVTSADIFGDLLPGTTRTTLSISSRPSVHLQPALEELIDYPYGCVEQTTSRLFALLHAPDLLTFDGPANTRPRVISDMIDAGIARLWSMQIRSGGLGYWPDSVRPDLWGTAYAADFLIQAQRAGRRVDAKFADEIAKYLEGELNRRSDEPVDDNMRAHLCYVLAAFKHPQRGWMDRLSDRLDQLDVAGRAHLAAAWLELGRKDRAAAALAGDLLVHSVATTTGARLTSQVRQEAALLGVLLDLDKGHAWIPALVERLEKARRNGRWGNTLENASALAVLARYQMLGQNEATFQGTVRDGGTEPRPFDHRSRLTFRLADDGRPIEIESSGRGDIYLSATTQGLLRQTGPIAGRLRRGRDATTCCGGCATWE
jgi:uncharacterized protein YfaS (alpha-2-macroglobulin family)